jgi:hypothetical protein
MLARVFESPQMDDIDKANPEFREVPFDAHSQTPSPAEPCRFASAIVNHWGIAFFPAYNHIDQISAFQTFLRPPKK